jgi:outer membrane protein insertion porin family
MTRRGAAPIASLLAVVASLACGAPTPPEAPVTPNPRRPAVVDMSCGEAAPGFYQLPPPTADGLAAISGRPIEAVCIYGTTSEPSRRAVRSALRLGEGETMEPGRVRSSLEALAKQKAVDEAAIGYELRAGHVLLLVEVRERPIVTQVTLDGAISLDSSFVGRLGLKEGAPLDPALVLAAVGELQEAYTSRGFGGAQVTRRIEELGPGRVAVRFSVDEGPQWTISALGFARARAIPEAELRSATGLSVGEPFTPDMVELATFKLASLYADRGMADAKVTEPTRIVAPDGRVTLGWTITEGDVYRIASLRFTKLGEPLQNELSREVVTRPGAVFGRGQVASDLQRVVQFFARRGQRVAAEPSVELEPKKKAARLVIEVAPES